MIDLESTLARLGGDRTLLRDVARVAMQSMPPLLDELRSAVERSDAARAAELAHRLKGSLAYFDAPHAHGDAAATEAAARSRDFAALTSSTAALSMTLTALFDELRGIAEME